MKIKYFFLVLFSCLLFNILHSQNIFPSTGNTGIGTTTPTESITIQGDNKSLAVSTGSFNFSTSLPLGAKFGTWTDASVGAAGIKFYRWTGNGTNFHVAYFGQAISRVNGITDYGLDFKTNVLTSLGESTTSRLFISSLTGNVGIGITNPSERLAVNGTIRSKEIKVEIQNWPDYVFTPHYHPLSLPELERQIQQLGHLPGFPSAQQVESDGVSLGQINKLLLEKMEEMSLYMIAQDKRISELEKLLTKQHKNQVHGK